MGFQVDGESIVTKLYGDKITKLTLSPDSYLKTVLSAVKPVLPNILYYQ